jgi:DNA replication and repair protein RecF
MLDLARGGAEGAEGRGRPWSVAARFVADGRETSIGAGVERTDGGLKRVARLDGRPAAAAELAAIARMSWVTPAMDRLFAGPASERRRFFDRLVLGIAPEHGRAAAAYEKALRERQRLLTEGGADPAWLAGLEREMAAHGTALAAGRAELLALLQTEIAARPEGAFPEAALALEGRLEQRLAAGEPRNEVEASFLASLRSGRARDAAAGRCLEGPHRSDLAVRHAAKDMPAEHASTGEQKALLLGIVLAHAHAAGPALLLLDEAAAHLDPGRRAALFDELLALPGQPWLTGAESGLFDAFETRAQRLPVGLP